MGRKGDEARALFEAGYNCCQSVAGAFAEEMGLPFETAVRLASGFGGGLGRMRENCGTVSGMILAYGMIKGYSSPEDYEEKVRVYTAVQRLAKAFQREHGTLSCRELLGLPAGPSDPAPARRTKDYYEKRPCGGLAASAADLLAAELGIE